MKRQQLFTASYSLCPVPSPTSLPSSLRVCAEGPMMNGSTKAISKRPGQPDMKAIVLGLGRTGSSSMREALVLLGFGPSYHMWNILEDGAQDAPLWRSIWKSQRDKQNDIPGKLDAIFSRGGYTSAGDYPVAVFPEALYDAYPDAKFILTVRNPDRWHESVMETLYPASQYAYILSWVIPMYWRWSPMLWDVIWDGHHKGQFRSSGRQQMVEHHNRVKRVIPAHKLLVYQVGKDGWGPLCKFLDIPIPTTPFPHVNDRSQFSAFLRLHQVLAWAVGTIAAVIATGAAFWAYCFIVGRGTRPFA